MDNSPDPICRAPVVDRRTSATRAPAILPPELSAEWQLELLELATADLPIDEVRSRLRQMAIRLTGGIGAASLTQDEADRWQAESAQVTGRLPAGEQFSELLARRCPEVLARGNIVFEPVAGFPGLSWAWVPVVQFAVSPECLLVVLPAATDLRSTLLLLQRIEAVLRIHLQGHLVSQSSWKLNSLATLVELVSSVEASTDPRAARLRIANELARQLNCPLVAVGSCHDDSITTLDVSGARTIDPRSHTYHDLQQALEESLLRAEPGQWPSPPETNHLLLAHQQLAARLKCEAIFSQPLKTIAGQTIGCWLFAGPQAVVHSERFQRFIGTAAPRVAGSLEVVQRTEYPWSIRQWVAVRRWLQGRRGMAAMAAGLCLAVTLAWPTPYRIRGQCLLAPREKRYAVAPYDGLIARGLVRPGDHVRTGDLLAELDDRSLNIELSGVAADHLKAIRQQGIELAEHNIAKMQLASLEAQRLAADEQLLRYRQENLRVRSPMDGVVLAGSLERAESAAVRRGQILFEIASPHDPKIEVEIPAADISQIAVGQRARVWIEGLDGAAIEGNVAKIHAQAELRNGKLVFVVEVTFTADLTWPLYPGMRGFARIDGPSHPLAWNLFRRPYEWLRSYGDW